MAINGPWGSGKSSAINLLAHHLAPGVVEGELKLVTFNPWWFRGEEALVLAFFRELYSATNPSLSTRAKKSLSKLGARLLKAGSIVSGGAEAAGMAGIGTAASGTMDWLSGLIEDGESVEQLHRELATALRDQPKRFVVFIDDIDRLAPDEALAIFRLVKSVGRLPNVIYVLAFDRVLAERVVSDRFPSEGPHYLEKIVQASFELPSPEPTDLQGQLLSRITDVCGHPEETLVVHFMNMFYGNVAPEVHTPRDVIRYGNALSVTWPAVEGEVDAADFIALEAYRIFQPTLYQVIRANPGALTGRAYSGDRNAQDAGEKLDALLLTSVQDKQHYREGLMRLFPKLESIWNNTIYDSDAVWVRQRRACINEHFPTYFRLSVADATASRREISALIERARDFEYIRSVMLEAVNTPRRYGGTRARLLLDGLINHAAEVDVQATVPLLSAIFSVADELDVEADEAKGFEIGDNSLRLHWLLRALLRERTTLEQRSEILTAAAKGASLGWLASLVSSAWDDFHPRDGKELEAPENCILTEQNMEILKDRLLLEIQGAASTGDILERRDLARLLYTWRDFGDDEGAAVKAWTAEALKSDVAVAKLAKAFTSSSWGQGFGDLVAKRSDRAQVATLDTLMDVAEFRRRVEQVVESELLQPADKDAIQRFLRAWRHLDEHGDR